jgi:ATP-binding cassette subfamily C protein
MPHARRLPTDGPEPTPGRRFAALARDVARFAGMRMAKVAVLTLAAVVAEGVGLLFLVPLLHIMGINGSERVAGGLGAWLGLDPSSQPFQAFGLEAALAVYLVVVAAAAWVVQARGQAVTRLRFGYVDDLCTRLHAALSAMEWRAFARLRGAEVTNVLVTEAQRASVGVEFLLRVAGWAIEVPVLLAIAAGLSPGMTGGALALSAVGVLLSRPLNRRTYVLGQAARQANAALHADLTDELGGMRVVRGLGLEAARHARFGETVTAVRSAQLEHQRAIGTARAVTQVAAAAVAAVAVAVAVRGFGMALADTLVLVVAFARLANAALRIQDGWRTVLHTLPAHTAAQDLLARCTAAAEPAGDPVPAPDLRREIRLEGVAYRHTDDGPSALDGIDATIPARLTTAVVGPSGAGKSTLVDLLLGLAPPSAGRVLIDDRPLEGPARRAWRQAVGYVPQDSFLFHDTIRANLAMAAPGADEGALWRALERASAAGFVRALPLGLDSVVGDRGASLSGGERQRIAIARALLREPEVLVLDEATSALDAESERRVLGALEALHGTITIIVVAHRPSTVRGADRVIVLQDGRVAASGPWAEVACTAAPLLERLHLAG